MAHGDQIMSQVIEATCRVSPLNTW